MKSAASRSTRNFNPRPPRGERLVGRCLVVWTAKISIHALREESDDLPADCNLPIRYFNPRPPRGGRRLFLDIPGQAILFQSTPSARRATESLENSLVSARISIHALREEGDIRTQPPASGLSYFNPRPPRGGRLCCWVYPLIDLKYFNPRPPRGGRPDA